MSADFAGRTVLVTGAAHGFGRVIAGAFATRGATVFVCDVVEGELAETVAILGDRGHGMVVDVTNRKAVGRWVEEAERYTGRLDVLVNNAGGVLGQIARPVEEVATLEWEGVVAANQTAAFWTSQAVAPAMKRAGAGRIVNVAGSPVLGPDPTGIQAHASAKAGLVGLTRQLAHELGPFGITVNAVAPGLVLSNDAVRSLWEGLGHDAQQDRLSGIALRRLGTPADVAHAVLFLASEQAGWISGAVLPVDGGR